MYIRIIIYFTLIFICNNAFGTIVLKENSKRKVSLNAYIETYYTHDIGVGAKSNTPRLNFLYNNHVQQMPAINLAFVKVGIEKKQFRSNVGIMYGTYSKYNLANEPRALRYIYEANIGIKLSKKKNIWLDAGILPSHIGFEYAKGIDNYTLTRSLIAENSPYFETGVCLSYKSKNEKLYIGSYLLNGWQRISWLKGNKIPSVGFQLTYNPTTAITLNYSNFIGSDKIFDERKLRIFHNMYFKYEEGKVSTVLGVDVGMEQAAVLSSKYSTWYGLSFVLRYQVNKYLGIAGRFEAYSDKKSAIVSLPKNNLNTSGISFNLDVKPIKRVMWRNELKWYHNASPIFENKKIGWSNNNVSFCTAVLFDL